MTVMHLHDSLRIQIYRISKFYSNETSAQLNAVILNNVQIDYSLKSIGFLVPLAYSLEPGATRGGVHTECS